MHPNLLRAVDPVRDHMRGGGARRDRVTLVVYGDYLCPYCRRLSFIIVRLRQALGEKLAYVFRHLPNERAHPGATYLARVVEAAARQGRFWDMHDRLYAAEPPLDAAAVMAIAGDLGLDIDAFQRDIDSPEVAARVDADLADGRRNGVVGTPTFFVDGLLYDGAWDFHSMLDALQKPVAERLQRSARAFASLPASGGIVLIAAAVAALICANSLLAPLYHAVIAAPIGIGPPGGGLSMPVGEWLSEGLLAVFFLIVGLDIRREMTGGALSDPRAAILPVVCAVGGVIAPALIYLAINQGPAARGWSVPTATDIAFTLGILALFGSRIPIGLRVFVAALAVVDDILSVGTLAVFYSHGFRPGWLAAAALWVLALAVLNRARVYAAWPYLIAAAALWLSLHLAGIHGALAGIVLAGLLPTRPAPSAGALLAQAATALAALEAAEDEIRGSDTPDRALHREPVWAWASRNLSAASDRLLSPADRFEQALSPWTAYLILPLFAFSATGVALQPDLDQPGATGILAGVVLGLVLGKPLGILLAAFLTRLAGISRLPEDVRFWQFVGGACLCGVGDTVALLMADQAFGDSHAAVTAKIGILTGSLLAGLAGAAVLWLAAGPAQTPSATAAT